MKKIAITGAGGYLGGRIFNELKSNPNYSVIGYSSNENNGTSKLDYCSLQECVEATKGISTVIYSSGYDAKKCDEGRTILIEDQLKLTTFLSACLLNNVKRFIYISSAHVYSKFLCGHIDERHPLNSDIPYAINHIQKECICKLYSKKIEIIVLRLSNSVGYPINSNINCWNLFVNDVCKQAYTNNKIIINGNINLLRDYVAIEDVIQGLKIVIDYQRNFENVIFNLGGDFTRSLFEMATIVREVFNSRYNYSIGIEYDIEKATKLYTFKYSINEIKNLGYFPQSHERLISEINGIFDALECC